MSRHTLAPLLAALGLGLLAGCQSLPAAQANNNATTSGGPYPEAYDQLDAMLWTQTSIEKELIFHQTYATAIRHLQPALQDPTWDALPDPARDPAHFGKLPPAIILDVDETVLTNTPLSARDIKANRGFDYGRWNVWVEERNAKALPGALEFIHTATALGIHIYYITNREHSQAQATLDNLIKMGFPAVPVERVLGASTPHGGCEKVGYNKTCRRAWVGSQHRVLMLIGDSFTDFVQPREKSLAAQREAVAPYVNWLGTRWHVLPNPTYGDWFFMPFGGDESLPEPVKRAAKHRYLITD